MDLYTSLDVTEKILSVFVAVGTLLTLASVYAVRSQVASDKSPGRVEAHSRVAPNRPLRTVIIVLPLLLLVFAVSFFAGHRSGKNTSLQNIQAIREVIDGEGEVIIQKDLALLDTIYAPDAIIIHCPAPDEEPDVIHEGRERIRERYTKFFQEGWTSLSQVDLSIAVENDSATAISQGIVTNAEEFIKFTAKFTLERDNKQWVITRFECGLTPD